MAPISPLPGAISGARSPAAFFGTSTIGRIGSRSIASWIGSEHGRAAKRGKIALQREHHRERLVRASLACAQRGDRGGIRRIAQQMIAADAFDRDDLAGSQRRDRRSEGIGAELAQRCPTCGTRDAVRSAGRRSARRESAGRSDRRIRPRTVRAQGKARHRRIGAVIGQALDQRVARAALGAIDEGIAEAPIVRVVQFGKAIVAGEVVRRHVDVVRARAVSLAWI